jgi:putative transposase
MSRYRRQFTGSTFFFVVVVYRRRPIFCTPAFRTTLRRAVETVRLTRPFAVDAWVLLPDHMHCIWTLPEDDRDYSTRWAEIKRFVSSSARDTLRDPRLLTSAGKNRGESTIWQRRFWEHRIRDEDDYERHFDYTHFNPVTHGYVKSVCEWSHSTFHRYVREGIYPRDWGGSPDILDLELE